MPRFIVTTGSKYDPFTYDELAKPLMQMQEAQNTSIESYEKLASDTAALERYITNNPEDSEARAMYDNYTKNLQTLTDNLYNTGYNSDRRRELARAREGFNQDITRIATAIKDRQDRGLEYRKMKREHPEMILGKDPSTGGLNDYLRNPLYGTDYYSYSGTQFSQEVLAEAKARAVEMLDKYPEVYKDPKLKGYLEQIKRTGFTNKEVDDAYAAARSLYDGSGDVSSGLDFRTKILYDTLITQMEHTGAPIARSTGRLGDDEFTRLLNYGRIGLSGAVGPASIENLKDLEWEESMARGRIAYANALQQQQNPIVTFDYEQSDTTGEGYDDAQGIVYNGLHKGKDHDVVRKDGSVVSTSAQASYIVHSGDLRRVATARLGFDPVGVNEGFLGTGVTTQKRYTYSPGKVKMSNGKAMYTRYNPLTNKVEVSETGERGRAGNWKTNSELTQIADNTRIRYKNNVERYKAQEPELYAMGDITPGEERKLMEDNQMPFGTTLLTFEQEMASRPENQVRSQSDIYVAADGTDAESGGIRDRITRTFSRAFKYDNDGKVVKDNDAKAFNGQPSYGFHYIEANGLPSEKAIIDPNEFFTFDDNGKIMNVKDIQLSLDGIARGYFTLRLKGQNNKVAAGVSSMKSVAINSLFNNSRRDIQMIINSGLSRRDTEDAIEQVRQKLTYDIYQLLGFNLNLQTQGHTKQENENVVTSAPKPKKK